MIYECRFPWEEKSLIADRWRACRSGITDGPPEMMRQNYVSRLLTIARQRFELPCPGRLMDSGPNE